MGGGTQGGTGRDERPQAQAARELSDIARKGYQPGTSALPDQRPVPEYATHRPGGDGSQSGGAGADAGPSQPVRQARREGLLPEAGAAGPPLDAPSEQPPEPGSLDPQASPGVKRP